MDSVIRGVAIFLVLILIFRVAGKRTLHETTSFDFVLLLIIAETVQQAMIDSDESLTNAFVLICTLMGINILFSILKQRFVPLRKLIEGTSVVLVDNGKVQEERMMKERVDMDDIIVAGREKHGLERLDQIKYAVLEKSGAISIVQKEPDR